MEKRIRIWVLLIGWIVCFQTALASTPDLFYHPNAKSAFLLSLAPASSGTISPGNRPVAQSDNEHQKPFAHVNTNTNTGKQKAIYHTLFKCKKKYKRIQSSTCKLKAPVRVATAFIPPTEKRSYTRPYFLLHLHHFLFRLTPF